ncbi:hypothetical protein ACFY00_37500 [Kitasatospora sp. NPDC001540]|uniref:hypothetical protein n=1 Tax=Kitasatospora sp. NPDC001540 TaxID=3364014 RepID=UPI0036AAB29E
MDSTHPRGAPEPHGEQGLLVLHATFDRAYVLLLRGAADSSVSGLGADFARAAASGLPVLVDLAALHNGGQEFLALLIDAHRHGAELIGPLSPSLSLRLAMTGLTDWFTVHPTLTAALDHLPPPAAPGNPGT